MLLHYRHCLSISNLENAKSVKLDNGINHNNKGLNHHSNEVSTTFCFLEIVLSGSFADLVLLLLFDTTKYLLDNHITV